MSWLSGYQKGNKLKELRRRIIRIAASYVGQTTQNGQSTPMNDPIFDEKMRGVGWQQVAWCNYTVRLIYKEALTTGNAVVGEAKYPYDTWTNGGSGKYLAPPVNKNGKTIIKKWPSGNNAQSARVENTRINYQAPNNYIPINQNPSFERGQGDKNYGLASRAKEAIEGKYVLPGDYITFDWSPLENSTKEPYRFNQHIGIYIAPAVSDCSKILCIEGNIGGGRNNRIALTTQPISTINGFGQLITKATI